MSVDFVEKLKTIRRYCECRGEQNKLGLGYQLGFVHLFNQFPAQVPFEPIEDWVQSHKGAKPAMKKQPDTYRSSQFLVL